MKHVHSESIYNYIFDSLTCEYYKKYYVQFRNSMMLHSFFMFPIIFNTPSLDYHMSCFLHFASVFVIINFFVSSPIISCPHIVLNCEFTVSIDDWCTLFTNLL